MGKRERLKKQRQQSGTPAASDAGKHADWIRWGVGLSVAVALAFGLELIRNRYQLAEQRRDTHHRLIRVSREFASTVLQMWQLRGASYATHKKVVLGDRVPFNKAEELRLIDQANAMLPRVNSLQAELLEILNVIPTQFQMTPDLAQRLDIARQGFNEFLDLRITGDLAMFDAARTVKEVDQREVQLEVILGAYGDRFQTPVLRLAEALATQL